MPEFNHICPECHESLQFDLSLRGQQIACPVCSKPISLPLEASIESSFTAVHNKRKTPGAVTNRFFRSGAGHAREIYDDLLKIRFREEVLPIDQSNMHILARDFVFWGIALLGTIPLLIITVRETNAQLTMFALFFALVWGVIFKKFVLKDNGPWGWAVVSLFFTGIVGIWALLLVYRFLVPDFYLKMPDSPNQLVSLLGFIFQVGIWEEVFKAIPILLLCRWRGAAIRPIYLVTIGVFSGLGFAAFENLHYGENAISSAYTLTRNFGVDGLVTGVQNAMVITMLRAVSLVFCHAVWSGIVAYFIATAMMRKEKIVALIILGIAVAAFLHGLYDWFAGIQPTIAALLAGFSFALFYGYVSKLQSMAKLFSDQHDLVQPQI